MNIDSEILLHAIELQFELKNQKEVSAFLGISQPNLTMFLKRDSIGSFFGHILKKLSAEELRTLINILEQNRVVLLNTQAKKIFLNLFNKKF